MTDVLNRANTGNINKMTKLAPLSPKGSKLIFFAPLGVGVNEENQ
jgi:hypothetical protein